MKMKKKLGKAPRMPEKPDGDYIKPVEKPRLISEEVGPFGGLGRTGGPPPRGMLEQESAGTLPDPRPGSAAVEERVAAARVALGAGFRANDTARLLAAAKHSKVGADGAACTGGLREGFVA